jgi:hypothetical protein
MQVSGQESIRVQRHQGVPPKPQTASETIQRPADAPRANRTQRMIVTRYDGVPNRLYLDVHDEAGRDGYVIVDSGTSRSWLKASGRGPEFTPDAYVARLGGERMHMLGRRVPFTENHDKPIIGCVGNDYLLAGVTVLDLGRGHLTRMPARARVPGSNTWHRFPIEVQGGIILTQAVLGGKQRTLLVDTGAPSSILIGQRLGPNARHEEKGDVYDQPLDLEQVEMPLQLPDGSSRVVPVELMEHFAHLENDVARPLKRHIDGILGLSSLGGRRVIFDRARKEMLLEP